MWENAVGHWSHEITSIRWDDTLQRRDGSLNLGLAEETKHTKHGQTSIVQFLDKAISLGFLRPVLVESEWIVKVEGTSWDDLGIEFREFTNLSSLHVMLVAGNLAVL